MHTHNVRGFGDDVYFFYCENIQLSGFIYDLFLAMCHFSRKELRRHLFEIMSYIIPAKWGVFESEIIFVGDSCEYFFSGLKCMDYI